MNNTKEQVLIDLPKLKPSPLNTYKIVDLEDMIGSIKSMGLITPLSVIGPSSDGEYEILSGERRFSAICQITEEDDYDGRFAKIPCYIVGPIDMNPLEQQLIIETANLETRDFNAKDEEGNFKDSKDAHRFNIMRLLKQMQDDGKITKKEVVNKMIEYTSISGRYARMYKKIFEEGEDVVIKSVSKGNLQVEEAATYIANSYPEIQRAAVEGIEENIHNKAEIMNIVKEANAKKSELEANQQALQKRIDNAKDDEQIKKEIAEEIRKQKQFNEHSTETGEIIRIVDNYTHQEEGNSESEQNDESKVDPFDEIEGMLDEMSIDELIDMYGVDLKGSQRDIIEETTGKIAKVINEKENKKGNNFLFKITNWVNKMMTKTKFSKTELELFELFEELIEYAKEVTSGRNEGYGEDYYE